MNDNQPKTNTMEDLQALYEGRMIDESTHDHDTRQFVLEIITKIAISLRECDAKLSSYKKTNPNHDHAAVSEVRGIIDGLRTKLFEDWKNRPSKGSIDPIA